jgi:Adenylate and Guanylate cyclase catalytic domain
VRRRTEGISRPAVDRLNQSYPETGLGPSEEGTHERLKAHLRQLIDPKIKEHRGHIVKNTGDGMLAEFASVVDAMRCAAEVQQAMSEQNTGVAADNRIELRIGINLGDVIVEGDDLYGDGVNIAARIEALADAGGVFVSNTVYDQVRDRLPFHFEDLGEQQVKNIARPVRVYRVRPEGPLPSPPPRVRGREASKDMLRRLSAYPEVGEFRLRPRSTWGPPAYRGPLPLRRLYPC